MSEIEQLKKRIDSRGMEGIPTAQIRDDYEPIGVQMIRDLTATGKYITARVQKGWFGSEWRIFPAAFANSIYER